MHDIHGAPTTSPEAALDGINDFVDGFVRYELRASNVVQTADEQPGSALANLHAGCLWMFLERPEAPEKSALYSERAKVAGGMNARETGLLALLEAWQRYDYRKVLAVADELLDACPQDLSTLKIAQYQAFNAGNAALMLKQAEQCKTANEGRAQFHSMLAFAHEQCHQLDFAEHAANTALSIEATEPWAQHALAHIHLGRGSTTEGLAFMSQHAADWQGLNSFMFTHNWWHLAVFSIAEGETQKALEIFDERCWGVEPDYSQDQIGAVSLLARLECAGVDVGDRWQRLTPYLNSRVQDVIQPFLSLQYLYGLAKAQRPQADELLQLIHQQASEPIVVQHRLLWQQVGIPAAVGVHAHALGNYSEAAKHLSLVRHRMVEVGGSHAQRDLFDQLLLDAYMQTKQWASARKMLEARCRYEPHNLVLQANLAAVKQQ
ncbi:MAG: hypothetical protein V3U76_11990 [Granulosicoccus sp.]